MKVYLRFFTMVGFLTSTSFEFESDYTLEDLINSLITEELTYLRKALSEDCINSETIEEIVNEYLEENGKMYWRIEGEI